MLGKSKKLEAKKSCLQTVSQVGIIEFVICRISCAFAIANCAASTPALPPEK